MSVKIKIFWILFFSLVLFLFAQYQGQKYVIQRGFTKIENEDASNKFHQVSSVIKREVAHLDNLCHDWGAWDAMVGYVKKPSPEFIDESFDAGVLADNRVDFGQLLDVNGSVVWQQAVDFTSRKTLPFHGLPEKQYPSDHILVSHSASSLPLDKRSVSGVMVVNGKPAFISSRPILYNDNKGPVSGTIILGRYLSDECKEALGGLVGIRFEITTLADSRGTGLLEQIEEAGGDFFVDREEPHFMHVYGLYYGLNNEPVFVVAIKIARTVMQEGWNSIKVVLIISAVASVVILVATLFGLIVFITRPISVLSSYVANLDRVSDYKSSLDLNSSDEIKELANSFDKMVRKISLRKVELEYDNRALKKLAEIDSLTQLANRRVFDQTIAREWSRIERAPAPLSLILCDVDYFKLYNDTYGHAAGDETLRNVASLLKMNVRRAADLVARYGGEEFAILLPGTPLGSAVAIAEKIRSSVEGFCIEHTASKKYGRITMSFGVAAVVSISNASIEQLMDIADKALYQAKQDGRNKVVASELIQS